MTAQLDGLEKPQRLCSIEGCDQLSTTKKMCRRHYQKWRYWNNPQKCAIKDCQLGVTAKGLCSNHYTNTNTNTTTNNNNNNNNNLHPYVASKRATTRQFV